MHIDASPVAVYTLVSDVTRMGEWSPETYRCEWVDGGGPQVGARFKAWNKRKVARWSNTPEVIAAEPGREFAFRRRASGTVAAWRYRLDPAGGGTDLTESYVLEKPPPGFLNWIFTAMMGVNDRDADLRDGMAKTLARIKAIAESGATK